MTFFSSYAFHQERRIERFTNGNRNRELSNTIFFHFLGQSCYILMYKQIDEFMRVYSNVQNMNSQPRNLRREREFAAELHKQQHVILGFKQI